MSFGSGVNASILAWELEIFTRNKLFFGGEDSCRFNNVFGSSFVPLDSARILLHEDVNAFAVDEKFSILRLDVAFEATMN